MVVNLDLIRKELFMATNLVPVNERSNSYWIEQLNCLESLEQNKDFRKVMVEGFLTEKPQIDTKALAAVPNGKGRKAVVEELMGVSILMQYFDTIRVFGMSARQSTEEFNEG